MRTKKHLILGLVALFTLASCQRELSTPINPTYNAEDNSVLTKLSLNISTSSGPDGKTKMTADAVQVTEDGSGIGSFRGMDAVHLLAYKLAYSPSEGNTNAGQFFMYKPDDASSIALRDFDLGTLFVANEVSPLNSSRTVELTLPLGTNALMLYAKAPKTAGEDDAQGKVDLTHNSATAFSESPSSIKFKLADRLQNTTGWTQFTTLVSGIITAFFRSGLYQENTTDGFKVQRDLRYAFWWDPSTSSMVVDPANTAENMKHLTRNSTTGAPLYNNGTLGSEIAAPNDANYSGLVFYAGSIEWKDYGTQYAINAGYISGVKKSMLALEESLGGLYAEFCHLQTQHIIPTEGTPYDITELRSGSVSALLRTIGDLAVVVNKAANGNATSPQEQVAVLLAQELQSRLLLYFNPKVNTDDSRDWSTLTFKSISEMKPTIIAYTPGITEQNFDSNFGSVTDAFFAKETGFPLNLGMPAGSSILSRELVTTGTKEYTNFSYLTNIPAYGMGDVSASFPITNYRYPPELMYFANSNLWINNSNTEVTIPETVQGWEEYTWTGNSWAMGSVTSSTHNVAMVKQVNYGNAMLQSQVKYADNIPLVDGYTTVGLHDNNSVLHENELDNVIPYSSGTALKVTGIMIGGQPDYVGWNYIWKDGVEGGNPFDKMIYDRTSPFLIPGSGNSKYMYTLCWDNYNPAGDVPDPQNNNAKPGQDKVYIALELVNNTTTDFWGELNMVRAGGTFYLLGVLDPNSASSKPTTLVRSNYFYPPFDANGNTIDTPRVFMQDYVTKATLVLDTYSLRHAYVTVPDLRASQITLGLSVDMEWKPGMVFSNVVMGGN